LENFSDEEIDYWIDKQASERQFKTYLSKLACKYGRVK